MLTLLLTFHTFFETAELWYNRVILSHLESVLNWMISQGFLGIESFWYKYP